MQEAFDYLAKIGIYHIATVDNEGKPHVRPFGSMMLVDGKFYIYCSLPKAVDDQLAKNKWLEISAVGESMGWIRIAATARAVTDDEKIRVYAESPYADPNIPIERPIDTVAFYELTDATATIYGMSGIEFIALHEYKW